ncbi:hypothetical protein [Levilactobacillus brevis]|uniref:hypothetical protein n=1 Tax=Levilactobacillus brevis TaxID=1580 RepID=UPI000BEA41A4|nr:hypothetical protein [Levilactobacillus brevis]STX19336.1 Uncharacterised protein [Levilactobacillus brevis]
MNNDQIKFRQFLIDVYQDQRNDMIRTIVWLSNHFNKLPHEVHASYLRLSSPERNAVIREVCMMGDDA